MRPPLPPTSAQAALLLLHHICISQRSLHSPSLPTFVRDGELNFEVFPYSRMPFVELEGHR